jgi:hypothetical protein
MIIKRVEELKEIKQNEIHAQWISFFISLALTIASGFILYFALTLSIVQIIACIYNIKFYPKAYKARTRKFYLPMMLTLIVGSTLILVFDKEVLWLMGFRHEEGVGFFVEPTWLIVLAAFIVLCITNILYFEMCFFELRKLKRLIASESESENGAYEASRIFNE